MLANRRTFLRQRRNACRCGVCSSCVSKKEKKKSSCSCGVCSSCESSEQMSLGADRAPTKPPIGEGQPDKNRQGPNFTPVPPGSGPSFTRPYTPSAPAKPPQSTQPFTPVLPGDIPKSEAEAFKDSWLFPRPDARNFRPCGKDGCPGGFGIGDLWPWALAIAVVSTGTYLLTAKKKTRRTRRKRRR